MTGDVIKNALVACVDVLPGHQPVHLGVVEADSLLAILAQILLRHG